jgi:hypothetical protein
MPNIEKLTSFFIIQHYTKCCNPSLGLATKARVCKVAGQEGSLGVTSCAPGMQKSVREWTLTVPSEPPLWELESQWTPEFSEGNCRGQNPLHWRFFFIIGKLLKLRFLKWARMTHLDIWNMNYDQKKGRESNWQFGSRPLKVSNRPNFLVCRWHATYCWKFLDKGYNFALDRIAIVGLHTKLWGPKVAKVLTLVISKLPFGSPETKCHLDVGLVERHRVYNKGEGGRFPSPSRVESCEFEVACGSS